ncbi:MAG: ion transporter, partial [Candidatus Nealsonbacteria bacterium]|nr:ion transporter [Candidatus Nealsonbacteria bacterium]
MNDAPKEKLDEQTAAWCNRAERFIDAPPNDPFACLAIVREGIFLRRTWDRTDPDAAARRRLLGLLAAAENVCHRRLAETVDGDAAPDPQRVEHVTRRLAEDDAYLARLLGDHTIAPETVAFAVECFRDDVHWLGTLVALLDGRRGIDFTGRVLLEQESLQRQMTTWQEDSAASVSEALRQSARRLRSTALGRQAEALLGRDRPGNLTDWYVAWQAASRLMMRPKGAFAEELQQRVEQYRAEAVEHWQQLVAELPREQQQKALRRAADDLADAAGESLTFMEDLPPNEAIRALEIISEDAATCMTTVKTHAGPQQKRLQRRLRRRRKALAGELQERRLNWRMEGLFGRRAVAALERLILVLLILFVAMLVVETPLVQYERNHWPGSNRVEAFMAWADLAICMIFLGEFALKMNLARPRQLFLRRNWVTMLVPSIPFGFIMYMVLSKDGLASVEAAETIVLLRLFRLPRMIRFLRFARPLIRVARLAAFVMQTSDRLVRRVAPLLNRNLVLFDRAAVELQQPAYRTVLASLRERFFYRASEAVAELPPTARSRLVRARIDDLTAMLSAPQVGMVTPTVRSETSTTREIPLEGVIARLLAATPAGISDRIGRALAQSVARWCRAFDVFAVRRLPLIRDLVSAGRRSSPYGATAQVANRFGSVLNHWLDRLYWIADLYGTLTAPQLVDSIGDWMVRSTARPARRLLLIGSLFLLVTTVADLLPFPEQVNAVSRGLKQMIGAPLIVLGLLCLIPLLLGLWFRQIAGEATDFCNQVAEAQYITATKRLKRRFAQQHREILHRRVIEPEEAIGESNAVGTGVAGAKRSGAPDPTRQAVALLFEDYLDGAPFHCSDTKTTTQLLGNLALVSLREMRLGCDRRQRKLLRRLDLAATRSWLRGPYLWFH